MNRSHRPHHLRRSLVAVTLACAALAGCSTANSSPAADDAGAVTVDKSLHAALPADVRSRGELVIATDPSYAPMESYGPDGRSMTGMEPELAKQLGTLLGVRVKLEDVAFNDILADVASGTVDLGLSAITDTAERSKTVDFVDYFQAGTAIIVQRGNPQQVSALSDLCGKVVASERGTVQADLLLRTARTCPSGMTVQQYKTNSDALLRLRTGRAAAVLNDLPPAVLLSTDAKTRDFYQLASATQYEVGYFGIAVAQSDTQLSSVLRKALDRLIADGSYAATLDQWHLESGAVKTSMINSGRSSAS